MSYIAEVVVLRLSIRRGFERNNEDDPPFPWIYTKVPLHPVFESHSRKILPGLFAVVASALDGRETATNVSPP